MLPSPNELKKIMPLTSLSREFISNQRKIGQHLLSGLDKRVLIIAGPCSIHDEQSALEYANKLKNLSEAVEDSCVLVMRVYCEKARSATGWKGYLFDPDLNGKADLVKGIYLTRKLFLKIADMQLPVATEFVDPMLASYFEDLISWGFIGARTCSSQPHRQLASFLSMPIGFKNNVDGNVEEAINGVISARQPHTFLQAGENSRLCLANSQGNPQTFIVLRGSNRSTNFDSRSVTDAEEKLVHAQIEPRLVIDCAHGNCQKNFKNQEIAFSSTLRQIQLESPSIMGMMIESHLYEGHQALLKDHSCLKYGVSITDPCLDWHSTEQLIRFAHSQLLHYASSYEIK